MGDRVRIEDVIKVATLGEGTQGTVWSARVRGSRGKSPSAAPYALKQRLIRRRDAEMRDTKSSSALREIEFYRKVANKHPEQFSRLYDWEIKEATQEVKDTFKNDKESSLKQFTHVLITLSARKEGVLSTVYRSLNRSEWLSMLAQVCYGISLIHDRGFSHGDVWEANVAFMRVPKHRDILIYRTTVPSFGFEWSIIDYGSAELHVDESADAQNKKRHSSYELDDMISLASGEDEAEEICRNDSADTDSPKFKRMVFSSLDGPSIRAAMKKTGLPMRQVLALVNLDSYLWHVCGHERTCDAKPYIGREALLKLSEAQASYKNLALYFSRLARESRKDGRRS